MIRLRIYCIVPDYIDKGKSVKKGIKYVRKIRQ